jgi:hypothetical protein
LSGDDDLSNRFVVDDESADEAAWAITFPACKAKPPTASSPAKCMSKRRQFSVAMVLEDLISGWECPRQIRRAQGGNAGIFCLHSIIEGSPEQIATFKIANFY